MLEISIKKDTGTCVSVSSLNIFRDLGGGGCQFFALIINHHRPAILTFGVFIAIDEFANSQRSVIAKAETGFQHACITTRAVGKGLDEELDG